ncbi:uncharacterized protein LOC126904032 [Daktulosphaira vitifoliae]|uniref:uncharacterized protein LOC126904032 n=1 Tax=Daktulosphaira vitifoliae TaxID=58002 RepID=UPI0021A9F615|nr:uncharacterized protein LOC126904032 [Daktulosphaira vitifoliae]
MSRKRKRKYLTLAEKVYMINLVESNPKKKYGIANQFGITKSALSTLLKSKNLIFNNYEIFGATKVTKFPNCSNLCEKLTANSTQTLIKRNRKIIPICNTKRKGDLLKRYVQKKLTYNEHQGKQLFNQLIKKNANEELRSILEHNSHDDIFIATQFNISYKQHIGSLPQVHCSESDNLIVLICVNLTGNEKLEPLVVCKKPETSHECPPAVNMDNVMPLMFNRWLEDLDEKMYIKKRRIILLTDSTLELLKSHAILKAVNIRFISLSLAGCLEDLFKTAYKTQILENNQPLDLYQTIKFVDMSLKSISTEDIKSCFRFNDNNNHKKIIDDDSLLMFTYGNSLLPTKKLTKIINKNNSTNDECRTNEKITDGEVFQALETIKGFLKFSQGVTPNYVDIISTLENIIDDNVKSKKCKKNYQTEITDFYNINSFP